MKGAIMTSGGGGTKLFAAIGVTYPAGSTVTCTKGTKTLTAKNTSGQWVFAIPEAGTWTVTAGSKSTSVEINSEGQFEAVKLTEYVIFNGTAESAYTGGWDSRFTVSNVLSLSVSSTSSTNAFCTNGSSAETIDLTEFRELVITVDSVTNNGYVKFFVDDVVQNGTGIYDDVAGSVISNVDLITGVNILDVSGLTGSYYIGVLLRSKAGASKSSVSISKIVGVY